MVPLIKRILIDKFINKKEMFLGIVRIFTQSELCMYKRWEKAKNFSFRLIIQTIEAKPYLLVKSNSTNINISEPNICKKKF